MKILKIFGIVVGIHVFLLVLVFAIPGCSSTVKTAPTAADTAPKPAALTPAPAPTITVPPVIPTEAATSTATVIAFNPDTPAAAAPIVTSANGVRFVPTRPDTPVAGALVAQPVDGVTPATSYTVKSGDNLWTIAKKNNLSVAQLTAANSLATNANLRPGQKLIIPSKAVTPAPAAAKAADSSAAVVPMSPAKSTEAMKHTVRSGETLGGIARIYSVRQGDIAVANNISDPAKIRPGMELVIPGWEPAKGTKSSKAPAKAGAAAKTADPKPAAALLLPPAVDVPPPPAAAVPVIRIDEGPAVPAPKS